MMRVAFRARWPVLLRCLRGVINAARRVLRYSFHSRRQGVYGTHLFRNMMCKRLAVAARAPLDGMRTTLHVLKPARRFIMLTLAQTICRTKQAF